MLRNNILYKSAGLLAGVLMAMPALAVDKLYTPYVEKGEWEVEYFGKNSFDSDGSKDHEQKHEIALGYGVTDSWKTEIYGIFEKEAGDHIKFDAVEWENIFQLTKRGEYWLDVGASLAYEWTPESSKADALEARLLLAKDLGHSLHILNVIAEKQVGAGPREDLEGALLWSSRYRYSAAFQPGFEISSEFGELSETGSFDDQKHAIGPAAYGKLHLPFGDEDEALGYRVGYLFGISDAAPDGELVLQLEYELEF